MSAGWLVYALVTGTLVAIACFAVEGLCREHRIATRWIWSGGLLATVLLSARALLDASATVAGASMKLPAGSQLSTINIAPRGLNAFAAAMQASAAMLRDALIAVTRLVPVSFGTAGTVVWLVASVLALFGIALVHLRITRVRRTWPLAELHGHDVRIAPTVGPAVLGVLQPFIVVPRWLLARSADEQRLVLAHESEHVRGRDHLLLTGACVAAALVPWHPAVWVMLSRLRLAIELDCDARVLRRGVAPRTYGTLLIDLAGQCSGFSVGATALADEASHLERRLLAMKPNTSRHVHLRAGALVAAGLLAMLAACEAKVPTSAEVQNMDVASAEKSAASFHMIDDMHGANSTFYIDGVKSDAATAHTLDHSRIASIEVTKINGVSEIRIATLAPGAAANIDGQPRKVRISINGDSLSQHETYMIGKHAGGMNDDKFTGVLLIDGVRADPSRMKTLDPASIVSVNVIKGPRAMELSKDPAAVNGLITITTKAGAGVK